MRNTLQLFDMPVSRWFTDFESVFNGVQGDTALASHFKPAVDVRETEEVYIVSFDVPGVKKSDIKIELNQKILRVSGERQLERRSEKENLNRSERFFGQFIREFSLPDDVNAEAIEASYEDGVLHVVLPKTEKAKPRNIEVGTGQNGWFKRLVSNKKDNNPQ